MTKLKPPFTASVSTIAGNKSNTNFLSYNYQAIEHKLLYLHPIYLNFSWELKDNNTMEKGSSKVSLPLK